MQLIVDVGNSRIKWAYWDGYQLRDVAVALHRGANFDRLLHHIWRDMPWPERVWISNVVGKETQEALTTWVGTIWQQQPIFLKTQSYAFGVQNGYQQPEALGIDRWLAMIAGFNHFESKFPVCIIDCGTCLTADVIHKNGHHIGGLLLPGIHSMRLALATYTEGCNWKESQISSVENNFLARNTYEGIVGGTLFAAVAYIERLLQEFQREFEEPIKAIVTGGEASNLAKLVNYNLVHKPNLVLEGVSCYAAKSSEDRPSHLNHA